MDIRYKIVINIVALVFLIILARLYFLSIVSHEKYEKEARHNIIRTEMLVPARGQILDRNNQPLAINSLGYSISLSPYLGRKKNLDTLDKEISKIVSLLPNLDAKQLKDDYMNSYSSYNHNYIKVANYIPYEEMYKAYTILTQSDNIKVSNAIKRYYPNDSLASHIIGYIGSANDDDIKKDESLKFIGLVGKSGLERYYNDFLQGELGYIKTKVDVLNQTVEVIDENLANKRHDMTLGIDIRLQKTLDSEFDGKAGAAIVMDAHSGEILSAGSYPEYNLNYFIDGISNKQWSELINSPNNPFLNKMINGTYPPGSVIKMGVGLSFLEFAGINEHTIIDTPAYLEVGNRKFRDWKVGGHGSADLIKALRRSVDVYFYKLSQKIGDEKMASTLSTMGFGEKTGVDLPNESSGILPTKEWKLTNRGMPWLIGDTIITSIGQGLFLATPMQVARYTALLATAKLPTPHFVKKLGDEEVIFEAQDVLSDFQKSKLSSIALGMYQVCNEKDGTAYKVTLSSPIPLACKTGTAQVVGIPQDIINRIPESQMEYYHRSHAWITAFLPYKNPKYVITILVEHGGSSGRATGPIITNIVKKMNELGYFKNNNMDIKN
ncbi:penicillin-binding protein 2 [Helicobacter sp. MIT 99-5507]|uniref:penicillin-binding protein 2 n=1 Tax=Helicobacter sp. MIT 99-5507 TaxID=152489 RepID=UPI000E1EEF0B|nr:penicillin-binding protein 2 [Helicobacter sp. MIT 99-5507]RDU57875.1 penicillin-binding protein 2 [Helicobacter sp. MIT 99-5507]